MVSVDSTTGRIVVDIGSAFNKDVYLAAHVTAVPLDDGSHRNVKKKEFWRLLSFVDTVEAEQIQKHLEVCSYDEYDDFKPRHPLPKEKVLLPFSPSILLRPPRIAYIPVYLRLCRTIAEEIATSTPMWIVLPTKPWWAWRPSTCRTLPPQRQLSVPISSPSLSLLPFPSPPRCNTISWYSPFPLQSWTSPMATPSRTSSSPARSPL